MSYLRNAWYPAVWGEDVRDAPVARVLLEEEVVLFRRQDGEAVAMSDRCPHRFAPLHGGKVVGDAIQCPYHGLQFGPDGSCTHNPHGNGRLPTAAKLKVYPIVERHRMLWLWMGKPELADPALLPDFSLVLDDPDVAFVCGTITIPANYKLLTDNLLDLTHVEFLHPQFGAPGTLDRGTTTVKLEGDTLLSRTVFENEPPAGYTGMLWQARGGSADEHYTRDRQMRWNAPASMQLTFDFKGSEHDMFIGTTHLLTPTKHNETQYLWAATRNGRVDDKAIDQATYDNTTMAFKDQDGVMATAQQDYIGDHDLLDLRPVTLESDQGAVWARRVLQRLIDAEASPALRQNS